MMRIEPKVGEPETPEQIAERLAMVHSGLAATIVQEKRRTEKAEAEHGVLRRYVGSEIYMSDFRSVSQMRAALNKATALAAERLERSEKAEAEVERLKEMLRHYGMVCDNPDQCLLVDDTKEHEG